MTGSLRIVMGSRLEVTGRGVFPGPGREKGPVVSGGNKDEN